jgi:hypothetical protein
MLICRRAWSTPCRSMTPVMLALAALGGPAAIARPPKAGAETPYFVAAGENRGRPMVTIDPAAWQSLTTQGGEVALSGSRGDAGPLVLELSPRRVVGPWTTFEVATNEAGGVRAIDFDAKRVTRLSGAVQGHPGSWATLVAIDGEGFGRIMLAGGAGGGSVGGGLFRFRVGTPATPAGESSWLFDRPLPAGPATAITPDIVDGHWSCGVVPNADGLADAWPVNAAGVERHRAARPSGTFADGPLGPPTKNMRQIELAAQADYELYGLFGNDEQKTLAYIAVMYELVSDIHERDLRIRSDVVHVKVWTVPNDPWGNAPGWPKPEQVPVPFDCVQMLSGVQTGGTGVAYLPGTQSISDGLQGVLGQGGGILDQDVFIAAHELGHNFGSAHTHDYQLDACGDATGLPRRGSIMSYCNQAWSGGMYNADMFFHVVSQQKISDEFNIPGEFWGPNKAIRDCNQNGLADAADISSGASKDLNANGVPDECEDCNANGLLDTLDISSGASTDLNNNTIPDDCEPDCNANAIPDDLDIKTGLSLDVYGNGVPDECEPDCNASGTSDLTEIHLNMTLDLNRNAVLDGCEDCNANELPDLADLKHAHNFYAVSAANQRIQEHLGKTGVMVKKTADGVVPQPQDLIVTPDRRVLVSSGSGNSVLAFDADLNSLGTLVTSGSGGLVNPYGLLIAPDGSLLVASHSNHSVRRYDAATGAFLGVLVPGGSGGLTGPKGLAIGPNNGLFVTSLNHQVFEFDATSGAFRRIFVTNPGNGGLFDPRSLVFIDNPGRCLVVGGVDNTVFAYNAATGAHLGTFNNGTNKGKMLSPYDITVGPTGMVYVGHVTGTDFTGSPHGLNHLTKPRVMEYEPSTGQYRRSFVMAGDSLLVSPIGIAFMPDVAPAGTSGAADCNANYVPDACDITSGFSLDANANGIPDECEPPALPCVADCDADGQLTIDDFICFQTFFALGDPSADCDADGQLTIDDFICFQTLFALGC